MIKEVKRRRQEYAITSQNSLLSLKQHKHKPDNAPSGFAELYNRIMSIINIPHPVFYHNEHHANG